jgi:8-oxo-dGTP pyrophosphatase MutT (NUDIX family)
MIRAAGAVLWRRGADGTVEVAVISRPKYGDWSFPKGKLDPGETSLAAAVREVEEETGQRARPGVPLGDTRYVHHRGGVARDKVVEWWAMEALGGTFAPHDEVDALEWLPPGAVEQRLTYDHDRALLRRFRTALAEGRLEGHESDADRAAPIRPGGEAGESS